MIYDYTNPAVPLKLYGDAIPLFGLQQALGTYAACAENPNNRSVQVFGSEGTG